MPTVRLTDAIIRDLEPPAKGNRITYDALPAKRREDWTSGFGIRVTAAGHKAFVLTYTTHSGRQGRYTIGAFGDWNTTQAREEAKRLKREVDSGGDPVANKRAEREAPDMAALIQRFREEHLTRLRPRVAEDDERMIRSHILPHLGEHKKVTDVRFDDIDALHRKITKAGHIYRANRVVTLMSKMFSLATRWGWRESNPCKCIKRNTEHNRERYLTTDELARLSAALAKADRDIADMIRLLLMTGARRGEVLAMKWADVDLAAGTWSKPPSSVKQDKRHTVPLSAPARQVLAARPVTG